MRWLGLVLLLIGLIHGLPKEPSQLAVVHVVLLVLVEGDELVQEWLGDPVHRSGSGVCRSD